MEGFRIANFALQSAYLIGHLAFIVWFSRKSQPTPVWRWFTILNVSFWLWVARRFMETVVYLFFSQDNGLCQFAANFQYLGDTTAGIAFAIWNLHLAGYGRLAANPLFRAVMTAVPVAICALVLTNGAHHLIYVKLDMGQRIIHGPLFLPCLASIARDAYGAAISELVPHLGAQSDQFEGLFGDRFLRADATPPPREGEVLVTATDLTTIAQQRIRLDEQIAELQRLSESLDEENRNIDAYLDSLAHMQPLQDKRALVDEAYDDINRTLDSIEENFAIAKGGASKTDGSLEDSPRLSRECIARIRTAVAQLKEAS